MIQQMLRLSKTARSGNKPPASSPGWSWGGGEPHTNLLPILPA